MTRFWNRIIQAALSWLLHRTFGMHSSLQAPRMCVCTSAAWLCSCASPWHHQQLTHSWVTTFLQLPWQLSGFAMPGTAAPSRGGQWEAGEQAAGAQDSVQMRSNSAHFVSEGMVPPESRQEVV